MKNRLEKKLRNRETGVASVITSMEELVANIKEMTTEYGLETSDLVVALAIEQFETIRNYPVSWSENRKLADMEKNKAKIAMATIEIDSKVGAENQLSHGENGISRNYYEGIMAYKDLIGFVNVL